MSIEYMYTLAVDRSDARVGLLLFKVKVPEFQTNEQTWTRRLAVI